MSNNVKKVVLVPKADKKTWDPVPPIQLPATEGPYLISFKLTGPNANGVTFSNNPFWVRSGQKPDQVNKEDPQIAAVHRTSDGKELIVLNKNDNPMSQGKLVLHYQLNFDGYDPLDPIIENGGKPLIEPGKKDLGTALSTVSWNAQSIGIAILAVVVLLFLGGLIGRILKA